MHNFINKQKNNKIGSSSSSTITTSTSLIVDSFVDNIEKKISLPCQNYIISNFFKLPVI